MTRAQKDCWGLEFSVAVGVEISRVGSDRIVLVLPEESVMLFWNLIQEMMNTQDCNEF